MNRRDFLKTSTMTTVSTFLGGCALSRSARIYQRIVGANERIQIGVIGCGAMGEQHIQALSNMQDSDNVEIVAVCDVYQKRLDAAVRNTGGRAFRDYRALLDMTDLDMVLIATPEHWHHRMTMDSIAAEKHIYLEKPMAHTIAEANQIVRIMQNSRLKLQIGVQGMSDESYAAANQYIADGKLGKIVLAQIDYSRNYLDDFWATPIESEVRPDLNLDWRAWLGPAPRVPWNPERFFRWRRFWDYSGGIATDLFIHRITRMIKAIGLREPNYVVATGGKWNFTASNAEIPETFNMLIDYPEGPTVLLVSSMANNTPIKHLIRGHDATLEFTEKGFTITPQLIDSEMPPSETITFQKTGAEDIALHHRNLFNSIRRNTALNCDHILGYYGVLACLLGVQSFRQRKYMRWKLNLNT